MLGKDSREAQAIVHRPAQMIAETVAQLGTAGAVMTGAVVEAAMREAIAEGIVQAREPATEVPTAVAVEAATASGIAVCRRARTRVPRVARLAALPTVAVAPAAAVRGELRAWEDHEAVRAVAAAAEGGDKRCTGNLL